MKEQIYTSTPPMGRTACTEPQCLYKGALYLFFNLDIITARLGRILRIVIFRKSFLVLAQLGKKISSASFLSCSMFKKCFNP